MSRSQALYLKWRPTKFEEVVGQDHVVQTIRNALLAERQAHAYLFSGPRGTGKTTTARLLAKALNCTNPDLAQRPDNSCSHCQAVNEGRYLDLIEIDAASNTGVDDVRDLREKINFSPGEGRYKVYIVDEVHMLSNAAFNALLKTLEEPPPHAIFVLATTEAHKVPLTVTSRCQRHTFRRISAGEMARRLAEIVETEGLQVDDAVLELVARQATGSLRDAISLLDQLIVNPEEQVTVDRAHEVLGITGNEAVYTLVEAIAQQQNDRGLDLINEVLDGQADPRQFARQVVDYLRNLLLYKTGNAGLVDAPAEAQARMAEHAELFEARALLGMVRAFDEAVRDKRGGWLGQLPLELAFLTSVGLEAAPVAAPPKADEKPKAMLSEPVAQPVEQATKLTKEVDEQESPLAQEVEEQEAQPAPVAQAAGKVSLPEVAAQWEEVKAHSKNHFYALPALLDWCQPVEIEGSVLTLGCKKEFALSKLDTPQMRGHLEATLAEVTGHALQVKCVRRDVETSEALPDVSEDGVVAMGVKLGAKPRQLD